MSESLIKLGLRSQTALGGIQFLLVVVFGPAITVVLQNTYNRDTFYCVPSPNSFTKQLCYDKYTSALSPWLTPLYFVVFTYAVLFVFWLFFMVYGAVTLRQIKLDRQNGKNQSKKSAIFKRVYLLHVCFRLIFIGVMIGIFCSYQTLSVPQTYKCSLAALTTPIPFNQTEPDLHCHDQHYNKKSISNFAMIAIKVFIMILCIIEFIYLITLTSDKLLNKLLPDTMEDIENIIPVFQSRGKINLPVQTAHYIERNQVVDEIMEKLSKDVRMIVVVALPGMGKTQVAIHVCRLLEKRNMSVIFVNKQNKLSDICSEILHCLRVEDPTTGNDIVSHAKRKLLELKKDTVIVVDNTEDIQKQKDFVDFAKWLLNSAPKATLMITTREDVGLDSADIHTVHLEPLDTNSSAKLLQKVVADCGEYVNELCKLCGGIPLIIIHCACLLQNHFKPEVLVKQLRNNPIDIFRKTNPKWVYDLLGKFLLDFPEDIKRSLVRVSVFPSTFSAEDMQFLFNDHVELETVKTKMVKGSLLQTTKDEKYSVHPLVQAFCRKECCFLNMGDEGDKAKHKFNHHYLERIQILSEQFIRKDTASEAISTFRKEKANIVEAFKNCFEDTVVEEKLSAVDVANSAEVLDFLTKVLSPPRECTELYEKCREISKACDDKERLADSLNSLGFRHLLSCDHLRSDQGTLKIFQEAYDIRMELAEEKRKCQTHAHTISKLGLCCLLQGEEEKGRRFIHEGINMRMKLGVPLYVAAGYCDLGHTYRYCSDHLQAIKIWENETLPVYKRELGEHPWTASLLHWIGFSYKALAGGNSGEYADKAKRKLMEALQTQTKLLGNHLDTARSYVRLGEVLRIQGEFKLALEELEKGLKIREDVLGPDHDKTIATRNRKEELQRLYEESNKTRRNNFSCCGQ